MRSPYLFSGLALTWHEVVCSLIRWHGFVGDAQVDAKMYKTLQLLSFVLQTISRLVLFSHTIITRMTFWLRSPELFLSSSLILDHHLNVVPTQEDFRWLLQWNFYTPAPDFRFRGDFAPILHQRLQLGSGWKPGTTTNRRMSQTLKTVW